MAMSMKKEVLALNSIKTKPSSDQERLYSSRRLSRDRPIVIDTNSFDVYYRESSVGNIPFLWESQPGTPKIKSRESPLIPPLTPPPSFYSSPKPANNNNKTNHQIRKSYNNLVPSVLLPKLSLKKAHHQSPSAGSTSSSSWSTQWSSASSSPLSGGGGATPKQQHRIVSSSSQMVMTSSFDSRIEEGDQCESPVSTLCFRRNANNGRSKGCYSGIIRLLYAG